MTTVPPDLDLCVPEWMLLILWLIITPDGQRSHFGCEWKKGTFWNAAVPARMRRHGASRPDEYSQQRLSSRRKVEQPGLCLTLLEMSAGLRLQNSPAPPPPSPHCARAINHYQLLISSNDFEEKKYIHMCLACEFKICRRKERRKQKYFILVCCILIFIKCWLKYVPK